MNLRVTFSILLISLLTACGGTNDSGPAIPVGAPIAPDFSDADPVDSKGQRPRASPCTASTPHGFKRASTGPKHAEMA